MTATQPSQLSGEHPSLYSSRTEAAAPPVPDLSLRGITKRFPGVLANDNIDLDVYKGEVHAILGENGAGKSTLMKILYGYYHPDAGTISRQGMPIRIRSPHDGRQQGIGMVFQNFTLVPALTVAENVALFLPKLPFIVSVQALKREIHALSERYHFGIDPQVYAHDLSVGEQQKVEIIKLLLSRAEFLIFDEPTSMLAPHEVDELLEIFRKLRQDGLGVLFITHKLREVLAVADRITVLRLGRVAASLPAAGATDRGLVSLMLGSSEGLGVRGEGLVSAGDRSPLTAPRFAHTPSPLTPTSPVLEIRHAYVPDPAGRVHLRDISLSIHPGEIVGVAAVAGNGQSELGDLVLGLRHCQSGSIRVMGTPVSGWSPARALAMGIACIPEDPLGQGTVPMMSVLENMILPVRRRYAGWGGLAVRWKEARNHVMRALQAFGLRMPALDAPISDLSGGNVQRVVFARELGRQPKLLLTYHPTRGLDVPSANAAREMLKSLRANGAAVLLVSEDLDELFALSDRLVVMHGGRVVGTVRPEETNQHAVGLLMTGAGTSDG